MLPRLLVHRITKLLVLITTNSERDNSAERYHDGIIYIVEPFLANIKTYST